MTDSTEFNIEDFEIKSLSEDNNLLQELSSILSQVEIPQVEFETL